MNTPKRHALIGFFCLFATLLPLQAAAFEIRPNCDIRSLGLNDAQREKLQSRRQQHKDELRQINQENNRRRADINLRRFFNKSPFDRNQANKIAQERFTDDMQRTVAELNFYHDLFQMLNSRQQEMWLQKCVGEFSPNRF